MTDPTEHLPAIDPARRARPTSVPLTCGHLARQLRVAWTYMNSWMFYALLSATAAGTTAILAKVGVQGVQSNLATAIRTAVVLVFAWGIVFARGESSSLRDLKARTILFLVLSGVATGLARIFQGAAARACFEGRSHRQVEPADHGHSCLAHACRACVAPALDGHRPDGGRRSVDGRFLKRFRATPRRTDAYPRRPRPWILRPLRRALPARFVRRASPPPLACVRRRAGHYRDADVRRGQVSLRRKVLR